MAHAWRIVGSALVLAVYFAMAPFGYAAFALLQLVPVKDPNRRARGLQWVLRHAFGGMHAVLRVLNIIDYNPSNLQGTLPLLPCVLVANHPTLFDVSAIYAAIPNVSSAVKPTLYHRFWAKPLLQQAAQFEGSHHDPMTVARMLDDAVDRLQRGFHVLVFPEGTRSPEQGLHPFGRSAFEIAIRAQVPVVALGIRCSPRWLSKEHRFLQPPATAPHMQISVLGTFEPSSANSCSRSLGKMVSATIAEHVKKDMVTVRDVG